MELKKHYAIKDHFWEAILFNDTLYILQVDYDKEMTVYCGMNELTEEQISVFIDHREDYKDKIKLTKLFTPPDITIKEEFYKRRILMEHSRIFEKHQYNFDKNKMSVTAFNHGFKKKTGY